MNKYVVLILILFVYTVFIGFIVSDCAIGAMAGRPILVNIVGDFIKNGDCSRWQEFLRF